jgi:tetratricopeptide (TPR) repeat protein
MKVSFQHFLLTVVFTATSVVKVCAHGGFDEEIKQTDGLIAASPNEGQHWYHRAYLNFLHGDWQIALSDSEKAERLAPGKFPVDWLRAQALAAGDQLDVALTVISDFMNAHPGHPGGLVVRARILNKLKRSELALADFREALTLMPNPEPDLYLEVVDALQAQQRNEDAAQVLATGIAKLGNIPGLVLKALDLEIAIGRIDLALTRVDAMQNKAPRPEPWMARRASILAKAGRVNEARTAWQTLADHLAKLPNLERGSHAMSVLAEESQKALAELKPSANPDEAKPHAPAVQVTQTDPKMMFPSRSVLGPGSK